jgi:hypothetical protein
VKVQHKVTPRIFAKRSDDRIDVFRHGIGATANAPATLWMQWSLSMSYP